MLALANIPRCRVFVRMMSLPKWRPVILKSQPGRFIFGQACVLRPFAKDYWCETVS